MSQATLAVSPDLRNTGIVRHDLFATPVLVFEVPGMETLNRELVARLLEEEQTSPGLQRANHGGWHSEMTLNQRPERCYRELMQVFLDYVGRAVAVLGRAEAPPPA